MKYFFCYYICKDTLERKKPYKCHQCEKTLSHTSALLGYLSKHTKDKPYLHRYYDRCNALTFSEIKYCRIHIEGKIISMQPL